MTLPFTITAIDNIDMSRHYIATRYGSLVLTDGFYYEYLEDLPGLLYILQYQYPELFISIHSMTDDAIPF
jgi:hypothetical protein